MTKTMKKAIDWLVQNRRSHLKIWTNPDNDPIFDFPDYHGMPKSISYRLSSDEVDLIQEHWDELLISGTAFRSMFK